MFMGGMSRDITPTQIQVPVFFMVRLYANAEIGVPRGELPSSVIPAPPPVIAAPLPVIPAPFPVIPDSPRHSCEGRNLNQDIVVLTYTSP